MARAGANMKNDYVIRIFANQLMDIFAKCFVWIIEVTGIKQHQIIFGFFEKEAKQFGILVN